MDGVNVPKREIYEENPPVIADLLFNSVILSKAKDPGNAGAIGEATRRSHDAPRRSHERAHLLGLRHAALLFNPVILSNAKDPQLPARLAKPQGVLTMHPRRSHERAHLLPLLTTLFLLPSRGGPSFRAFRERVGRSMLCPRLG